MLVKVTEPTLVYNTGVIPLGHAKYALVDPDKLDHLKKWHWFAKQSGTCWYAVRKVTSKNSVYFVRMHRQIMHTPANKICHHYNGNSLDNRTKNLLNCTAAEHSFFH